MDLIILSSFFSIDFLLSLVDVLLSVLFLHHVCVGMRLKKMYQQGELSVFISYCSIFFCFKPIHLPIYILVTLFLFPKTTTRKPGKLPIYVINNSFYKNHLTLTELQEFFINIDSISNFLKLF